MKTAKCKREMQTEAKAMKSNTIAGSSHAQYVEANKKPKNKQLKVNVGFRAIHCKQNAGNKKESTATNADATPSGTNAQSTE